MPDERCSEPGDAGTDPNHVAPQLEPYAERHLTGALELCAAQHWLTYSEHPQVTHRAWTAPGATSVVAVLGVAEVVGFAVLLGDGVLQGYLTVLAVAPSWQRRGVGRGLVEEATRRSGVQRVDLLTDDAHGFYAGLPHRRMDGFRIYPLSG